LNRSKYILYLAPVLLIVLVIVFAGQVRRLQKQLRSSVRIVPGQSKTRDDAQDLLDRDVENFSGRPEVLVKFRAGISAEAIAQITSRFNDSVQDEIEAAPGLTTIDDADNADASAVAAGYQALPEVEYAEVNYEISLAPSGDDENRKRVSDPNSEEQWALPKIQAPQAWTTTKGSEEIVVAILDSGVEHTHAALANNIWTRPANVAPYQDRDLGTVDDVLGGSFSGSGNASMLLSDSMNNPLDENGRGTACAGVIGAECGAGPRVCGVNQKVRIMSLKFINAGGFGTVAGAVQAINYAIDRKRAGVNLRVISAGWGLAQRSRALEDVIGKAYEAGILFVAAAGDLGADNDVAPQYPAGYELANVLSVAASDQTDALAPFSNYGVKTVEFAAPGKDVLTTALGNDYEIRSGTSLAAAVVAGVAALALAKQPDLTVDGLRSLLLKSVDKVPALQGKVATGGRINAAKAVSTK
jgi:subtilisin family serine protease